MFSWTTALTPVFTPSVSPWFEGLSLRRKFFLVSGALGFLLALATFLFLQYSSSASIRNDIFAEATTTSNNFAASNWDLLLEENSPLLNENAQIVRASSNSLVEQAIITNSELEILAVSPFSVDKLGIKFDTSILNVLETREDVTIYEASGDSTLIYFISPVKLQNANDEPLGYAVVSVNESKISDQIAAERNRYLLFVLILFSLIMREKEYSQKRQSQREDTRLAKSPPSLKRELLERENKLRKEMLDAMQVLQIMPV